MKDSFNNAQLGDKITSEKIDELISIIQDRIFISNDIIVSVAKEHTMRETQKISNSFTDLLQHYANPNRDKIHKQILAINYVNFINDFTFLLKENQNSKHIFFVVSHTWLQVIIKLGKQAKRKRKINNIFLRLDVDATRIIKEFS